MVCSVPNLKKENARLRLDVLDLAKENIKADEGL